MAFSARGDNIQINGEEKHIFHEVKKARSDEIEGCRCLSFLWNSGI